MSGCSQKDTDANRLYQQLSNYNFENTLLNLDIAISEHNYRIIHRSNIGQAIRDRGEEYYPLSTVISFCNITYAKEMMEINSDLINDMPCIITVREDTQGVIVGTRLMVDNTSDPVQNDFAARINTNLLSIVQETIE
ncbi:MAG: DUF302 domain-containing protein [Piscirickettsiaceae bacterium]|nr:DUF302 domain-containing protein [Piscirickettsiaceae bacterium]